MQKNELLEKINAYESYAPIDYGQFDLANALSEVVKLTSKDIKHKSYVWLSGFDYAMTLVIQTIEKELG